MLHQCLVEPPTLCPRPSHKPSSSRPHNSPETSTGDGTAWGSSQAPSLGKQTPPKAVANPTYCFAISEDCPACPLDSLAHLLRGKQSFCPSGRCPISWGQGQILQQGLRQAAEAKVYIKIYNKTYIKVILYKKHISKSLQKKRNPSDRFPCLTPLYPQQTP